ncbi:MAG: GNAT family N-acetyltransferase [Planctomycetota bacterium]
MTIPFEDASSTALTFAVRDMQESDLREVVALDAAGGGALRGSMFAEAVRSSRAGERAALVALREGAVIGFIVGHLTPTARAAEPEATIEVIAVDPRYRGWQVGMALMRALRERLGTEGFGMAPSELSCTSLDLEALMDARDDYVGVPL